MSKSVTATDQELEHMEHLTRLLNTVRMEKARTEARGTPHYGGVEAICKALKRLLDSLASDEYVIAFEVKEVTDDE